MTETWNRVLAYLMARLKEPSTYPALIFILSAFGLYLSPEQRDAIMMAGLAAAGLISAAMPDRVGKSTRAEDVPLPDPQPPKTGTPGDEKP